jgi:hypothetical protein
LREALRLVAQVAILAAELALPAARRVDPERRVVDLAQQRAAAVRRAECRLALRVVRPVAWLELHLAPQVVLSLAFLAPQVALRAADFAPQVARSDVPEQPAAGPELSVARLAFVPAHLVV